MSRQRNPTGKWISLSGKVAISRGLVSGEDVAAGMGITLEQLREQYSDRAIEWHHGGINEMKFNSPRIPFYTREVANQLMGVRM